MAPQFSILTLIRVLPRPLPIFSPHQIPTTTTTTVHHHCPNPLNHRCCPSPPTTPTTAAPTPPPKQKKAMCTFFGGHVFCHALGLGRHDLSATFEGKLQPTALRYVGPWLALMPFCTFKLKPNSMITRYKLNLAYDILKELSPKYTTNHNISQSISVFCKFFLILF